MLGCYRPTTLVSWHLNPNAKRLVWYICMLGCYRPTTLFCWHRNPKAMKLTWHNVYWHLNPKAMKLTWHNVYWHLNPKAMILTWHNVFWHLNLKVMRSIMAYANLGWCGPMTLFRWQSKGHEIDVIYVYWVVVGQ